MESVAQWECLVEYAGSKSLAHLLAVRSLCRDSARIAEQHPFLLRRLAAKRKGAKRALALDSKLRLGRTRWASLDAVKNHPVASKIVAKHVKIGPLTAPSQKKVLDCLDGLDKALDGVYPGETFLGLLNVIVGFQKRKLIGEALFHPVGSVSWMASRMKLKL